MNSVTKPDFGPKGSTPAILLLEKEGISFQVASFSHEVAVGDHGYGKAAAIALGVAEERVFKTLLVALHGGHSGDGAKCGAKFAPSPAFVTQWIRVGFLNRVRRSDSCRGCPSSKSLYVTNLYVTSLRWWARRKENCSGAPRSTHFCCCCFR